MKPVTVAAFNSREEAEPLRAWLEAAGLSAEVHADLRLDELLDFERPGSGFRVEVPRDEFEQALALVHDWNSMPQPGVAPGAEPEPHPAPPRPRSMPWLGGRQR